MNDDDFDGEGIARSSDPWTSHEAAGLRSQTAPWAALRVYEAAGDDGCTFDDLVAVLHPQYAVSGIAAIPNRLLKRGLIEETGQSRQSAYGRANLVRRITSLGIQELHKSEAA